MNQSRSFLKEMKLESRDNLEKTADSMELFHHTHMLTRTQTYIHTQSTVYLDCGSFVFFLVKLL